MARIPSTLGINFLIVPGSIPLNCSTVETRSTVPSSNLFISMPISCINVFDVSVGLCRACIADLNDVVACAVEIPEAVSVAIEAPTPFKSIPMPFANGNTCPILAASSVIVVLPSLTVMNNSFETWFTLSASKPKAFSEVVNKSAASAALVTPPTANLALASKTAAESAASLNPAETMSYLALLNESRAKPEEAETLLNSFDIFLNFIFNTSTGISSIKVDISNRLF